ncbi:NAD-dependent epimerase/dehydratase family protein [Polycyclovorans algicola]|uniref:NAD-dependent epimerase/dehydratase family protein n=1 Tax=Polycyclovorans algicola TaxID=616992 RepID=UPI0004A7644A|nr:NAD-dependent epimerase/dehydratase family protein [Polycyclovorans algicola]
MKSNTRTILVTGAAGALARRVVSLLGANHHVIAVDFRRQVDCPEATASYSLDVHARGFEEIFRRHDIDTVIHIGRVFGHEQSRQNRYNANVLGSKRLFELSRKHGVRQVMVHSTYFVYGAARFNPALMDEDTPLKASEVSHDLVDAVELENLTQIYLRKYPELNITLLRPCNILGPGVRNSLSLLLSRRLAPVLIGYAPLMQFLHVDDMAEALVRACEVNRPGVYNVAPAEWMTYPDAVVQSGCRRLPLVLPGRLPQLMGQVLNRRAFLPPYLVNYLKYPVVIDGTLFRDTFDWRPKRTATEIFQTYRDAKRA